MASLNHCTFIGNLGRDPELKYLPSGDAVCSISIATSEKWKDKQTGEQKEKTEWIPVEFFGRLAEIVGQYCKKGSSIYVSGRFTTRKYQDKDGVDRYATSIKGDSLQLLSGRQDGAGQGGGAPAPQQRQAPAQRQQSNYDDQDIPF
jgi:single-strand DNA-binding protein